MFLKPIFELIYTGYAKFIGTVDFPATLDIELTNNCNLDCLMCSRSLMKRKTGYMDVSLLRKIVEELKSHPPKSIGLHLFGESLMHPDLIRMIRLIKENVSDVKLLLSTNAYFLNRDVSREIIDSGLDRIRFSLDGIDGSTYEKIRKGSDFERVVNNIKGFIDVRNSADASYPFIQMQIIGMKDTADQVRRFRDIWTPLLSENDRIIVQEFMTFAGRVPDRTCFKIASFRDRLKRRLPCLRLWKNLVIYWDGKVGICCYDYDGELSVGDIKEEPISRIWQGQKINSMRLAQLNGSKAKFALCRSCISQSIKKAD